MGRQAHVTHESAYLGFETGGTKLVAALAGSDGRVIKTAAIRRSAGDRAPESLERIVAAAQELLAQEPSLRDNLRAVGFGFGGTVRRSTNSPHLCLHEEGWDEVHVASALERRFGVPVFVENDCKLAALAEAHFGAGLGARSLFYVTLGTGVGGGFVLDGRILQLGDLGEAEIGHVVVDPDGPDCCCGSKGCVEALCSGPGLSKLCHVLAERSGDLWRSSVLFPDADPAGISSNRIIEAWEAGDRFAGSVVQYSAESLSRALGAMVNLLVPERVVIGGGLGNSTPRLLDLIRAETARHVVPYFRLSYTIEGSQLRDSVVSQGAAILARQRRA